MSNRIKVMNNINTISTSTGKVDAGLTRSQSGMYIPYQEVKTPDIKKPTLAPVSYGYKEGTTDPFFYPASNTEWSNQALSSLVPYITLTDSEIKQLEQVSQLYVDKGISPDMYVQDYLSVNAIANATGMTREEVQNNRDYLTKLITGEQGDGKITYSTGASIINAWNQGRLQDKLVNAKSNYKDLLEQGISEDDINVKAVKSEIRRLESEISYKSDTTKRNFVMTQINQALGSGYYMFKGAVAGALGGLAGGVLGGIFTGGLGASAGAKLGSSLARTLTYQKQFTAEAFYNMKQQGVSTETARRWSDISGLINALNEALLDVGFNELLGGATKLIGLGDVSSSFVSNIAQKVIQNGSVGSFLASALWYLFNEGCGEFIQEGSQSLTDSLFQALAEKEDGVKFSNTVSGAFRNALDEAVAGFSTGIVMGIAGVPISIAGDIKTTTKLKDSARKAYSKETYVNNETNRASVQKLAKEGVDLTEEQISSTLSGIYDSAESAREVAIKLAGEKLAFSDVNANEDIRNIYLSRATVESNIYDNNGQKIEYDSSKTITKDKDGRLFYTEESVESKSDENVREVTRHIGDPSKLGRSQAYVNYLSMENASEGSVSSNSRATFTADNNTSAVQEVMNFSYTEDSNNKTLTINSISGDNSTLREEAILELSEEFPSYEVLFSDKVEDRESIKSALELNSKTEQFGADFDTEDRAYAERWVQSIYNAPKSEREALATLFQALAKDKKMSAREFIESTLESDVEKIEKQEYESVNEDDTEEEKARKSEANAKIRENNLANARIDNIQNISKGLKATLYAGENANATTVIHEFFHVFLEASPERKAELSTILNAIFNNEGNKERLYKYISSNLDIPTLASLFGKKEKGKNGHMAYVQDKRGRIEFDRDKADALFAQFQKGNTYWSNEAMELSSGLFEAYLRNSDTMQARLKGFFRRVANIFRNVYYRFKNGVAGAELNEEVVSYFDSLFGADDEQREVRTGRKTLSAQTLYKTRGTYDAISIKDNPALYGHAGHADTSDVKIVDVKKEIVNNSSLFQLGEDDTAEINKSMNPAWNDVSESRKINYASRVSRLKRKYAPSVKESKEYWKGKKIKDFFGEYKDEIKNVIKEYPKVEIDGVLLLDGIDREGEMPFQKELEQAKVLQSVIGEKVILLPRYSTSMLSKVFGVDLEWGSLPDAIALTEGGKFVEFKITNKKNFGTRINEALNGGDIAFVVVDDLGGNSTKESFNYLQNRLNALNTEGKEVYVAELKHNLMAKKIEGTFTLLFAQPEDTTTLKTPNAISPMRPSDFNTSPTIWEELKENPLSSLIEYAPNVGNVKLNSAIDFKNYLKIDNNSSLFQVSIPEDFEEQLNSITEEDIGKPNETIVFSKETPYVFQALGMKNLSVEMYRDKLARGLFLRRNKDTNTNNHGHIDSINKEIISELSEKLGDPYAVYDSASKSGSLVAVYDIKDLNGNPIVASFNPSAKRGESLEVNLITSIYGKDNGSNAFKKWDKDGLLVYLDDVKKESIKNEDSSSYALVTIGQAFPRNLTLQTKSQLVNKKSSLQRETPEWQSDIKALVEEHPTDWEDYIDEYIDENIAEENSNTEDDGSLYQVGDIEQANKQNVIDKFNSLSQEEKLKYLISSKENRVKKELTLENWKAEVGETQEIDTPIGKVKISDNQYDKIKAKGREAGWDMLVPTLERPSIITKEEGTKAHPMGSYDFIKCFSADENEKEEAHWYYVVTVFPGAPEDTTQVAISARQIHDYQIADKLKIASLAYVTSTNTNGDLPSLVPRWKPSGQSTYNNTLDSELVNKNGEQNKEDSSLYQVATDLTEEFKGIKEGEITEQDVEDYINSLIGQAIDTSTEPLQIEVTKGNKAHIIQSNVRLNKGQLTRHQSTLYKLESIINNAIKNNRNGDVELTHNTNPKTLKHKESIEKYVYFDSPIRINEDVFSVELTTEQIKGQNPNLLDLYNIRVKKLDLPNVSPEAKPQDTLSTNPNAINPHSSSDVNKSTLYQDGNFDDDLFNDEEELDSYYTDTPTGQRENSLDKAELNSNIAEKKPSNNSTDDWVVEAPEGWEEEVANNATLNETVDNADEHGEWDMMFEGIDDSIIDSDIDRANKRAEAEEAVVAYANSLIEANPLPEERTLYTPDLFSEDLNERAKEFSDIITTDKEEAKKFLQALISCNSLFNSNESTAFMYQDETTDLMQSALNDIDNNIAPFIRNLVKANKDLSKLTDEAWHIVAGIISKNPELYMDLYGRASGDSAWIGTGSLSDRVEQELGMQERDYRTLTYVERRKLAEQLDDEKIRNKILHGGKVSDEEIKSYIKRAEEKAEVAKAEYEAEIAKTQMKYDEKTKEWRAVSKQEYEARKELAETQDQLDEYISRQEHLIKKLEKKAKSMGIEAGDIQEQEELKKKVDFLKKKEEQLHKALSNISKVKSGSATEAKEMARRDTLLNTIKKAEVMIEELKQKEVLTAKEASERIEKLNQQITKEKVNKAVKEARERYNKAKAEANAMRKIRSEKERMAKQIMKKPSANVALDEANQIIAIQRTIDPSFRKSMRVNTQKEKKYLSKEELQNKYKGKIKPSYNKQSADKETENTIKEFIYDAPKRNLGDGVYMMDGMKNNSHDLPFQKEFVTAKITRVITGEDIILLPRYMDSMLNETLGEGTFVNYSLSDGISAVTNNGTTYEFKQIGERHLNKYTNKATEKADVAIIITTANTAQIENVLSNTDKKVYIVAIDDNRKTRGVYTNKITSTVVEAKTPSSNNEESITKIAMSRLDLGNKSLNLINSFMQELPDVNSNDQTIFDYSLYEKAKIDENSASESVDINSLKALFRKNPNDDMFSTFTDSQLERLSKTSLDEMTLGEIEELYEKVKAIRTIGLRKRQAYLEQQRIENATIQRELLKTIQESVKYQEPELSGTEEEKNPKGHPVRAVRMATINMARKAQILDNDTKGTFYNLLIRKKRILANQEMANEKARTDKVMQKMKAVGFKAQDFYQTHEVEFSDGTVATYSVSALAYVYLSQFAEDNRDAVAYGNLITSIEKQKIREEADKIFGGDMGKESLIEKSSYIDESVRTLGDDRYNRLLKKATEVIESNAGIKSAVMAIDEDFNNESFDRIAELMARVYNDEVVKLDHYLPNSRTGFVGMEPADRIKNDIYNAIPGTKGTIEKGFTKGRQKISPINQTEVRLDLFGVWQQSVKDEEHLVANLDYIRQLDAIFMNNTTLTSPLRASIQSTYGEQMLKAIEAHIKEIKDPDAGKVLEDPASDFFKLFRGNVYSTYLGYRTTTIFNQLITSPAAFLGKVGPVRLASNMLRMATNWKEIETKVFSLSPFMQSRNFDLIGGEIKEMAKNVGLPRYKRVYNQFLEVGLKGLEYVDEYCVVAGWNAIYEQEIERLGGDETKENMAKASQIADEYVYETQPVSDKTELSPLFKNKNSALNALLAFQTSLNVVWQNIAEDIPRAFRHKEFRKAMGMIAGYAMAGALLALAHGDVQGDDDDDDRDKVKKTVTRLLYASTSQFIESIPMLSSTVDKLARNVIFGDKLSTYSSGSSTFPVLDSATRALGYFTGAIRQQDISKLWKAVEYTVDALCILTGGPSSALKDLGEMAINKDPKVLIGNKNDLQIRL